MALTTEITVNPSMTTATTMKVIITGVVRRLVRRVEGFGIRYLATYRKCGRPAQGQLQQILQWTADRKSTRLNSSHVATSYAVFCLKKKNHQLRGTAAERSTHRDQS